jgi:hypothetical protein
MVGILHHVSSINQWILLIFAPIYRSFKESFWLANQPYIRKTVNEIQNKSIFP